ncbi:hypothetical protein [Streptomyces parvus]|uniref:hypothetical protein n=1 Tax=Streptomyces parvus TaxID=66428 RepID=UPI00210182A9|nr:hypothetical protein [Streptomyces parvus]MCQ1582129.1 hypothetical protein [Streptomyces parvus]
MPAFKRTAVTLLAAAAVTGTTFATATTASAASYHCKTSSASVDNPAYSGPWADNYNFDVKLCAKRSGGYIYTYARVDFEGPVAYVNMTDTLDGARFHLQTKKSTSGTDPVVKSANYTGLEYKLEHGNTAGNGSYTTGTIKYKAGSGRYLADGYIQLDWNRDGRGYRNTHFSASPTV